MKEHAGNPDWMSYRKWYVKGGEDIGWRIMSRYADVNSSAVSQIAVVWSEWTARHIAEAHNAWLVEWGHEG